MMRRLAEDALVRRAEANDAALIAAIVADPQMDRVCVRPAFVMSLPELADYAPNLPPENRDGMLLSVLKDSPLLKTVKDKDGKFVIRTPYKYNPRNTLIMRNVPADANEGDLRELFLAIPTAASVSFVKDVYSCWLAKFDTEANAVATHIALLTAGPQVHGTPISVGVCPSRFVRAVDPAPATAAAANTAAAAAAAAAGVRGPQGYAVLPGAPQMFVYPYGVAVPQMALYGQYAYAYAQQPQAAGAQPRQPRPYGAQQGMRQQQQQQQPHQHLHHNVAGRCR